MIEAIPIWHHEAVRRVVLRLRLRLPGPCRGGEIRCAAAGAFQVYIGGLRVGGGPGGLLLTRPLWHVLPLSGAWDSGDLEMVVVVDGGDSCMPWLLCYGQLAAVADGGDVALDSGLQWHSRLVPTSADVPGDIADAVDLQMAEDAPGIKDDWQGVTVVASPPTIDADLVGVTEEFQAPETLLRHGAVSVDQSWASMGLASLTDSKCVHHEALLADGRGVAQFRTPPSRAIQLHYDLGRQICGWLTLRLRHGRGGLVEMMVATTRDGDGHRLQYHCGSERQEVAGLTLVRGRYLTVRLSGFHGSDVFVERVGLLERSRRLGPRGQVELDVDTDGAWRVGASSLDACRQEVYGLWPRPSSYDWLAGWILQSNDFAQTGDSLTARQALCGRPPEAPYKVTDWAYPMALLFYHLHADDADTVDVAFDIALQVAEDAAEDLGHAAAGWSVAAAASLALAGLQALEDVAVLRDRVVDLEDLRRHCHALLEPCWRDDPGLYAEAPQAAHEPEELRQWTNVLALLAATDDQRAMTIERALRRAGVEPIGSLTQAWVLAEALGRRGRSERLRAVIANHWLRRLKRPGLTWRDKRSGEKAPSVPGPDALLLRYLIGVRPLSPGWRSREVRPPVWQSATGRARVPMTAAEHLSIAWSPVWQPPVPAPEDALAPSVLPPGVQVDLEVSLEGETHVRLDRGAHRWPTIMVNDEVVWRNEKIYPNPSVHFISAEEDHILLMFERPGAWRIILE